jgi:hypothetical protein
MACAPASRGRWNSERDLCEFDDAAYNSVADGACDTIGLRFLAGQLPG